VLFRRVVLRQRPQGAFRLVRLFRGGDDAQAAAWRAFVTIATLSVTAACTRTAQLSGRNLGLMPPPKSRGCGSECTVANSGASCCRPSRVKVPQPSIRLGHLSSQRCSASVVQCATHSQAVDPAALMPAHFGH
jgi:hypothetical protein